MTAVSGTINADSVEVTVLPLPDVSLSPRTLDLVTSETGTITARIVSPAGPGGLALTLSSDNSSVVDVVLSVTIAGGLDTSDPILVTSGTESGTAHISVSGSRSHRWCDDGQGVAAIHDSERFQHARRCRSYAQRYARAR